MSTRTAASIAPRGGGGGSLPSTPWQRADVSQEPSRKPARGYALSSSGSNSRHLLKHTSPPHSLQERGDRDQIYRRNPDEYRRNGFEGDRSRHDVREREYNMVQGYDDRPRSYDRRPMVDGGNSNSNRSMARNDRPYDNRCRDSRESSQNENSQRRPMMVGRGGGNNNDDRRPIVGGGGGHNYNDRRPIRRTGDHLGNGYRDSMDHSIDARRENFGRDHEREQDRRQSSYGVMNDFGDHRSDRDRHPSRYQTGREHHTNAAIEAGYRRRRDYNDRGFAQQEQRPPNQGEHSWQDPSTISMGHSQRNNKINGYDDGPRFSNHLDTSDRGTNARNREGNRGMLYPDTGRVAFQEIRGAERKIRGGVPASCYNERSSSVSGLGRINDDRERDRGVVVGDAVSRDDGRFHSSRERQHHPERCYGRSESISSIPTAVSSSKEEKPSNAAVASARKDPASEMLDRDCLGSTSSLGKSNNNMMKNKKRQREDHERPKIELDQTTDQRKSFKIKSLPSKHAEKSSLPSGDTVYNNPGRGSGEAKKNKLSTNVSSSLAMNSSNMMEPSTNREHGTIQQKSLRGPNVEATTTTLLPSGVPSATKINEKPKAKEISVKSSYALSTKKHQIQAKPKPKVINKLGIPMRWLKPKAKPKPPVKKIVPPKVHEDTSKSIKIPSKQSSSKKSEPRPSSPSNRLVTDSSEGSSIVSFNKNYAKSASSSSVSLHPKKHKGSSVPAAIVTKNRKQVSKNTQKQKVTALFDEPEEKDDEEDGWDSQAESEESDDEASESDTDDNEVLDWATKMLGVQASPSSSQPNKLNDLSESNGDNDQNVGEATKVKSPKLKIRLSSALKFKLTESVQSVNDKNALSAEDSTKLEAALKKLDRSKKKREKLKALSQKINEERPQFDQEKAKMEIEEDRRKREEAKPLTVKEIRKILREDTSSGGNQNNWVRRSRRQPNMARLNSKPVRILVDKLKYIDTDMRVLKMKKYINDPNTPCAIMDVILNAMEENTNCEALYIQNFNEGMRDEQVIHLLRILQQDSCKIWCLNIGENYNISEGTWEKFTKGLMHTKITHMYASEHTITSDMKEEIRFTIRENRKKHDMHINPNNLDVIIQCTHCWWNPINAKVLRPFLKKKGYEHVLIDKEAQGLQGSTSMAPTS